MNLIFRIKSPTKKEASLELNNKAKALLSRAEAFYKKEPTIKEVLDYFTAAEYAFISAVSSVEMTIASYHDEKERLNTKENCVETNG